VPIDSSSPPREKQIVSINKNGPAQDENARPDAQLDKANEVSQFNTSKVQSDHNDETYLNDENATFL
jgi:hypothetical protein